MRKMFGLVRVVFVLGWVAVGCTSAAEDCMTSDGTDYRGQQQRSYTGSVCLNWSKTSVQFTNTDTGVGNHNFCRNPDGSDKPWCYVSDSSGAAQKQACDVTICQESNSTEVMAADESVFTPSLGPKMVESFEPAKSFPSQVEGAAVQPVKGVQQQVRTGPKKKKDLGTVGYVLAVLMMAVIILLGGGITMGYFYKRGRDLKKQHDQRVYEREMHRITLPLSAFANPTCELVDENTIVISTQSNSQTPTQESTGGSDPLMGPVAGTPGA